MFEIRSHGEFIEIHSSVLTWYSKFTGTGGHAKAGAFYPFIFTAPSFRKLSSERQEALLRHEKIHFAQQKESLHIWLVLFGVLESLYLILKHRDTTSTDRYLLKAVEQEAYFHMHDSDYLTTRRSFAYFQFLRSKPVNLDWLKENDPEFFQ